MKAIHVPEEIFAIGESLIRFIDQEVVPLENANKAILASERTIYDDRGRFTPEVDALRREVRERRPGRDFIPCSGRRRSEAAGLARLRRSISTGSSRPIAARAAS